MAKPLFLDTTIQVDRILKEQPPEKLAPLNALPGRIRLPLGLLVLPT